MEKFSSFILKIKWLIIILVSATTIFLSFQIPHIKINSDVINSLPENDKDAVLLRKIGARFGGNKTGMVIIQSDNIFTTEVLCHIRQITDTLSETENISSVLSLTNAIDIRSDGDNLEIGKLIDEETIPETEEELTALKDRVMIIDNYKGSIISKDGTTAIILFSISDKVNMQSVAQLVQDKIESIKLPEKIYFAGSPMLITAISRMIASDLIRLIPVAFLLIIIVLYLGFRSARGVVLPLLTAVLTIIWVIGIMALTGSEMTMVSNNIPIVLLAISTAYTIHVLNRINQVKDDLDRAIVSALSYVAIPIILAALTTIGGFFSFLFGSYLTMIRDFGVFTGLGTFIALLLSIFFIPALISALSWKNKNITPEERDAELTFFSKYLHIPLHKLLFTHAKRVLTIWIVITLISISGIFLIKRNVDVRNYFRKDNPTRIAEEIMADKFGGSKPVFVLFKGDIQSPEILNKMLETEEYMKKNPGIEKTQSIAGLISDINGAFGQGKKIPDEKDMVEQLWFLLEGNDNMNNLVSEDLDEAVIISWFTLPENKERIEFANYMKDFIDNNSVPGYSIEITGMPFIEVTIDKSLVKSQIGSLIIAVLFVTLIISIILRSFYSGLFAAIPIISTIIILFGIMGFTGIPLNIATVLVASVAMGIGIDYSIHVISHFNSHIKEGATISEALDETIAVSGKAILINLVSVSSGFLVLLFSEMVPLQYFGMLITLSMIGAGLSALTLLPVILILAKRRENKLSAFSEQSTEKTVL
ncbi:MAG TPA: MMPL family transporter [Bacteroidales bacterium]|nr:MMPL family transporter [Bacteroidales bacterium]